jgi:predicted AAA+ superfamily ATPase
MIVIREMQARLAALTRGFPVITITGPRQSGKTTLARLAYPGYEYLDLENMSTRQRAKEDPLSLFPDRRGSYILDEFQYAPELLSYVKIIADENQIPSQFILTGSNQFALMKDVSQSLAGRTAILELLPFSYREAYPSGAGSFQEVVFRGLYPRLVVNELDTGVFYDSYIRTYLQRDIRLLANVQDLDAFTRFLALCAGRTGSILNKESLANDTGVDGKTVSSWLSVLQASYIIYLLRPWHGNLSKRLIKSPKLYFYDTGLACNLLQMRSSSDLATHPLRGNLFETHVISETLKDYHNRGIRPPLNFFRESNGMEIDLLISRGGTLYPFEIKSAALINSAFYGNLLKFGKLGLQSAKGRLVYTGDQSWENEHCRVVGWRDLASELDRID